jgi:hypothetical protein
VLVSVALPTPFKVVGVYALCYAPRGSVHRRQYKIERGGYEGPLEVSLADRQARHLQGVSGPALTVPVGETEFEYPTFLSPFLEVGRTSRTCIMAVGTVKDADGSEHRVSFSSVNQNEQIVVLTDPGLLSLQAARNSLLAAPGESAALSVRVERSPSIRQPVRVELIVPPHVAGVSARPVELAADDQEGVLRLEFGDAVGPLNMPLVLRATAAKGGDRVVAEAKVQLVPVAR